MAIQINKHYQNSSDLIALFPGDVRRIVLMHFDPKELRSLSRVSKTWNVIMDDPILWKYQFKRIFRSEPDPDRPFKSQVWDRLRMFHFLKHGLYTVERFKLIKNGAIKMGLANNAFAIDSQHSQIQRYNFKNSERTLFTLPDDDDVSMVREMAHDCLITVHDDTHFNLWDLRQGVRLLHGSFEDLLIIDECSILYRRELFSIFSLKSIAKIPDSYTRKISTCKMLKGNKFYTLSTNNITIWEYSDEKAKIQIDKIIPIPRNSIPVEIEEGTLLYLTLAGRAEIWNFNNNEVLFRTAQSVNYFAAMPFGIFFEQSTQWWTFNLETLQPTREYMYRLPRAPISLTAALDGRHLVLQRTNGHVEIWDMEVKNPIAKAAIRTHGFLKKIAGERFVIENRTKLYIVDFPPLKASGLYSLASDFHKFIQYQKVANAFTLLDEDVLQLLYLNTCLEKKYEDYTDFESGKFLFFELPDDKLLVTSIQEKIRIANKTAKQLSDLPCGEKLEAFAEELKQIGDLYDPFERFLSLPEKDRKGILTQFQELLESIDSNLKAEDVFFNGDVDAGNLRVQAIYNYIGTLSEKFLLDHPGSAQAIPLRY